MVRPVRLCPWLALALLAGCVPAPEAPPPRPPAPPRPAPAPPPPSVPELAWDVAPVTPGDWRYQQDGAGTVARFGEADAPAPLAFRCHPERHQIDIIRAGAVAGPATLTIRTSAGDLHWSVVATGDGQLVATRPARDPGFDWIAYSRGRFAVEVAGLPRLVVPAWAEVSRVIEDCRG